MAVLIGATNVMDNLIAGSSTLSEGNTTENKGFLVDYSITPSHRWTTTAAGYMSLVWSGSSKIDYVALVVYGLESGDVVEVENIIQSYTYGTATVGDSVVIYIPFPVSFTLDRLRVNLPRACSVAHVHCGKMFEAGKILDGDFVKPKWAIKRDRLSRPKSGGNFLPQRIRSIIHEFSVPVDIIDEIDIQTSWPAIVEHIRLKPFILLWDDQIIEPIYAWTTSTPKVSWSNYTFMRTILECQGIQ